MKPPKMTEKEEERHARHAFNDLLHRAKARGALIEVTYAKKNSTKKGKQTPEQDESEEKGKAQGTEGNKGPDETNVSGNMGREAGWSRKNHLLRNR